MAKIDVNDDPRIIPEGKWGSPSFISSNCASVHLEGIEYSIANLPAKIESLKLKHPSKAYNSWSNGPGLVTCVTATTNPEVLTKLIKLGFEKLKDFVNPIHNSQCTLWGLDLGAIWLNRKALKESQSTILAKDDGN